MEVCSLNNEMCVKGATRMRRVGDRGWRWVALTGLFEQKIAKYQNTPPDLNNFGNRSESPAEFVV